MIKSSVEWTTVDIKIRQQINSNIHTLSNKNDMRRMLANIGTKVTLLSKAEVLARSGQRALAMELLTQINDEISMIEEYMSVAALIG